MEHTPQLLKPTEAAEVLNLHPMTLAHWRQRRIHLPFVKTGRHVRYRAEDVEQFIQQRTVFAGEAPQ